MPAPALDPTPAVRARAARLGRVNGALVSLAVLALGACRSAGDYRRSADEQVYRIVEQRRAEIVQDSSAFSIEPRADSLRQKLLSGEVVSAERLSFVDCLEIAAENSREYQDRREALYLAALDLTLERWKFGVIPVATAAGVVTGVGGEAQVATAGAGLSLKKLLGTGAQIVGNLGLSLTRNLASGDFWHVASGASLAITQPLLRGFGSEIVKELLTQAERAVLYEARNYERFRRTFAVEVAEQVYRILQQMDTLENEQQAHENLKLVVQRNDALSQAGRLSDIEVGQAKQDELRADSRVIEAKQELEGLLDQLNLFLGLPVDAVTSIDPRELDRLVAAGAPDVDVAEDAAVALALAERLDYLTREDEVLDAERSVHIAADALRADLGLSLGAGAASAAGKPLKYNGADTTWTAGLALDLPIDRLDERNIYREELIGLEATRRARDEAADELVAGLREDLRGLTTAHKNYDIQQLSVELASSRAASTQMNLEAGRAETRDVLEAQEALRNAQNSLTEALIDYELARLALYRDLEALRVEQGGLTIDPDLPERLAKAGT